MLLEPGRETLNFPDNFIIIRKLLRTTKTYVDNYNKHTVTDNATVEEAEISFQTEDALDGIEKSKSNAHP
jgi:hypothetical protein